VSFRLLCGNTNNSANVSCYCGVTHKGPPLFFDRAQQDAVEVEMAELAERMSAQSLAREHEHDMWEQLANAAEPRRYRFRRSARANRSYRYFSCVLLPYTPPFRTCNVQSRVISQVYTLQGKLVQVGLDLVLSCCLYTIYIMLLTLVCACEVPRTGQYSDQVPEMAPSKAPTPTQDLQPA